MNEEFRQDDGKTDYRTFILYLFVRRSVPTSILQYQFANDMVRTKLLEKYFEDRSGKMSFSDRAVDACADYCLLYTSPSPRDRTRSRMPSSA